MHGGDLSQVARAFSGQLQLRGLREDLRPLGQRLAPWPGLEEQGLSQSVWPVFRVSELDLRRLTSALQRRSVLT